MSLSTQQAAAAADLHGAFECSGDATPPLGKFTKFMNGEHTPDGSIGEHSDAERPNSQASAGSKRKERNNEQRRVRKAWSRASSPDRNNRFCEQFVNMQDAQEESPEVPTHAAPADHIGSSQENAPVFMQSPVFCSQDSVMSCDDAALRESLAESLIKII